MISDELDYFRINCLEKWMSAGKSTRRKNKFWTGMLVDILDDLNHPFHDKHVRSTYNFRGIERPFFSWLKSQPVTEQVQAALEIHVEDSMLVKKRPRDESDDSVLNISTPPVSIMTPPPLTMITRGHAALSSENKKLKMQLTKSKKKIKALENQSGVTQLQLALKRAREGGKRAREVAKKQAEQNHITSGLHRNGSRRISFATKMGSNLKAKTTSTESGLYRGLQSLDKPSDVRALQRLSSIFPCAGVEWYPTNEEGTSFRLVADIIPRSLIGVTLDLHLRVTEYRSCSTIKATYKFVQVLSVPWVPLFDFLLSEPFDCQDTDETCLESITTHLVLPADESFQHWVSVCLLILCDLYRLNSKILRIDLRGLCMISPQELGAFFDSHSSGVYTVKKHIVWQSWVIEISRSLVEERYVRLSLLDKFPDVCALYDFEVVDDEFSRWLNSQTAPSPNVEARCSNPFHQVIHGLTSYPP
jgi:hypothetical protein